MATLHAGWRRIVSEIGIEFASPWAVDMLREAGQEVSGETVKFDPDWVMKQVAKAPREFDLRARNPKNNVHIGGDSMVFGAVYGPPFVREGDVRRDGSFADYENFCRLAQSFDSLDSNADMPEAGKGLLPRPPLWCGNSTITRHHANSCGDRVAKAEAPLKNGVHN